MSESAPSSLPPAMPPPIPQAAIPAPNVRPVPPKVKGISGAMGISTAELSDIIANGGRIVVFHFCVSALVVSFKRPSSIYLIRPGESAFGKSWPFCLISLVAGWWGIPWGPIWTVMTVSTNLGGGKDVTREVMASLRVPMPTVRSS
jgi:hypothetical protein